MTDQYVFNSDIHDEWKPPAHRCKNCAHHEHDVVPIVHFDVDGNEVGSTTGTRCYCNHGGKHFVTGDNNHCDYWEATEGNAKRPLLQLAAMARIRPDGVWDGD